MTRPATASAPHHLAGIVPTGLERTTKALSQEAAGILGDQSPHIGPLVEAIISAFELGSGFVDDPDSVRRAHAAIKASAQATVEDGRFTFLGKVASIGSPLAMASARFLACYDGEQTVTPAELVEVQKRLPVPSRIRGSGEWANRARVVLKRIRDARRPLW